MILQSIAQVARKYRNVSHFLHSVKAPYQMQLRALRRIIRNNRKTKFGKEHKFNKIISLDQFQAQIPVRKYNEFKEYIGPMLRGEQNVLISEQVNMFAITSGTTGNPKFIPVCKSFTEQYKSDWDIWAYYAYKHHPNMFNGKVLTMVAPEAEGHTRSGIPYGSISGVIQHHQTAPIRHFFSVPYSVYTIRDYDAKYYAILRIAAEQSITTLVTPNPSMILILCRKLNEFKEDIIRDIGEGSLSIKYNIEENIREDIIKHLSPNPKRALELIYLDRKKNGLYPKDIWKDMAIIGCWKEGTLPIYLRQFPNYFGDTPVRDIGLISTEGQSSVPVSDNARGGVLIPHTMFYEFLPAKDAEKKSTPKFMWELEMNRDYYLIITCCNGLYRYFTNDIVRVIDYYYNSPVIQFLHKGEHIVSVTGEKLTEWQAVHAMRKVSKELAVPVASFTLCGKMGKTSRYDILMELHKNCDVKKLKNLIAGFDEKLMELNVEYKAKRKSERLARPILKIVSDQSYAKLHRLKTEHGAHDAQVKITSLTDDPDFERNLKVEKVVRA